MTTNAKFTPGDQVLLRSSMEPGEVVAGPKIVGGEAWYQVKFDAKFKWSVEDDITLRPQKPGETIEDVVKAGRWGRMQAFRSAMAVDRITKASHETLFAFRSQRILFEPYQYKPLLKFLHSADRKILIADEVGLGKTVEAGLILAEQEARHRVLDRVLIACPARLREKWRNELSGKFGQDFDLFSRLDFENHFAKLEANPGNSRVRRLRAVASLQTLSSKALRDVMISRLDPIDLLIVDEAHHARNPSSLISKTIADLCTVSRAVLFLSATPLHLGTRDLFTLLAMLRPQEFSDATAFDAMLDDFKEVHEVAALVRTRNSANFQRAADIVARMFAGNTLADQVIEDLRAGVGDSRACVDLERRVQDLHPLATILTRSRKRDVLASAPERVPSVERCTLTVEEESAYRQLVGGDGWLKGKQSMGSVQRARQAASCLPAAIKAAASRGAIAATEDDAVETTDLFDPNLPKDRDKLSDVPPIPGHDSKLSLLLEQLRRVDDKEPGAKVIVFTFFLGTSHYLQEQLEKHGIRCERIAGDVPSTPKNPERDERAKRIRRFREEPDLRVLVSTEVGSEGLDFQFCHVLVNYDLPWNPMVVEQRIGRIDRFGQESPTLTIVSLVVADTVEDRILAALYERIGIFRSSLGQLEAMLSDAMSQLESDYKAGKLTPEEANERVLRESHVVANRQAHLDELEKGVSELVGLEEYVKEQLNRVDRLGRYLTSAAMLAVLRTFLERHHPDSPLWEEKGIHRLRISDRLRHELLKCEQGDEGWVHRIRGGVLAFCFDGTEAFKNPDIELVNASHSLIRLAVGAAEAQLKDPQTRVGRGRLPATADEPALVPGDYAILALTHDVQGLRSRSVGETVVWSFASGSLLPADAGERLLHLTLQSATEWDDSEDASAVSGAIWDAMFAEAIGRNRDLARAEERENVAQCFRHRKMVDEEYRHKRSMIERRLETIRQGDGKMLRPLEGQLAKAEADHAKRLEELAAKSKSTCGLDGPTAACLVRIVPPRNATTETTESGKRRRRA
jgi:ATP-dependent helicase HepA